MTGASGGGGRRWPHVALAVWAALVLVLLIWPAYDLLGNRVEPYVLGLPLAFAWNGLLAAATFLVLSAYYLLTERSD
jgi:hypothetical protein